MPNPPMVSEKKIVSTTSTSCLPIVLFSGSVEIHLVSRVNIIGSRAVLIRLKSLFLMRLFMVLNLEFSSLRFLSNNSTLVRAISGNFQSKEIIGIVATLDRSPLVLHLFLFRISLDQKIQKPVA
ncbi:hypothetical protein Bca4012_095561 [Brassica carinata]